MQGGHSIVIQKVNSEPVPGPVIDSILPVWCQYPARIAGFFSREKINVVNPCY